MTHQPHTLDEVCSTCISEDMAFQRTIKSHVYCVATHKGKYKSERSTHFIGKDYELFAHECKYNEKGR